jgi:MEDS: MEthanogen/methylotroph, DcmR Sensory domain
MTQDRVRFESELTMGTDHRPVQFAGGILGQQRHVCAFFNSIDEQHRVLRSFIKDGLDGGERAFHIVDPELRDDHLKRLAQAGIDVQRAMGSGQLEVRPWQEAYLRGDRFDQDAMLVLLEEVLQAGAAGGYPLTRLVAQMEWALLDKPGVDDLLEYETRVNYLLPKYEHPVICTYDLTRVRSTIAMDILRTHPVVIMGGLLHDNPFFVPPEQFLLEIRERRAVDSRERSHGEQNVLGNRC